jgi:hypothetical protein
LLLRFHAICSFWGDIPLYFGQFERNLGSKTAIIGWNTIYAVLSQN